jgi:Tol biopolymer transport system component
MKMPATPSRVRARVCRVLAGAAVTLAFVSPLRAQAIFVGRLVAPDGMRAAFSGSISPDGSRFVYLVAVGDTVSLWMFELRTGRAERLTIAAGQNNGATWSPDGRQLMTPV